MDTEELLLVNCVIYDQGLDECGDGNKPLVRTSSD